MVSEMKREDGHLVGHDLPYIRSLRAKTMSWESEVISRDCCHTLQYTCRTTDFGVNHIHSEMVVCACVSLSLSHTHTHTHAPSDWGLVHIPEVIKLWRPPSRRGALLVLWGRGELFV
jgi:hypothetical protein